VSLLTRLILLWSLALSPLLLLVAGLISLLSLLWPLTLTLLLLPFLCSFFICRFIKTTQTCLPDHIHKFRFHFLRFGRNQLNRFQSIGNNTLHVLGFYFSYPFNGYRVLLAAVRQSVPH